MQSTCAFPNAVAVRVRPADQEGLAVSICFKSNKKNDFHFTLFVDSNGFAKVTGEELLRTFDEDRAMFIMDYQDPRLVFTGNITTKVLSNSELARSLSALDIYRGMCSFPTGYEKKLRSAATRGQCPDLYNIDVEVEWPN
jgi:hypothetical protein